MLKSLPRRQDEVQMPVEKKLWVVEIGRIRIHQSEEDKAWVLKKDNSS